MKSFANLSELLSDIIGKEVSSVNKKKEDARGGASSCENVQAILQVCILFQSKGQKGSISYIDILKDGAEKKFFLKTRKSGSQNEVRPSKKLF